MSGVQQGPEERASRKRPPIGTAGGTLHFAPVGTAAPASVADVHAFMATSVVETVRSALAQCYPGMHRMARLVNGATECTRCGVRGL